MTETLDDVSAPGVLQLGLNTVTERRAALGCRTLLTDWVWQVLISYQLYLWGRVLRFRHGSFNYSPPWCCSQSTASTCSHVLLWHVALGLLYIKRKKGGFYGEMGCDVSVKLLASHPKINKQSNFIGELIKTE